MRSPLGRRKLPLAVLVPLASLALLAASPRPAMAWNDTGHMLTALVAWEQMDAPTRAWAIDLLRQHPRFEQDFAAAMPAGLAEVDRQRWLFARAATWPDVARGFEGEDKDRYHRSTWHYALGVFPLDDEGERGDRRGGAGTSRPASTAPATLPTTRPPSRPGDVHLLEALENAWRQLHADGIPAAERAVTLCWVLHLIGDIHQPCHAGSLVSGRFPLPDGDRGANNVLVEGEGRAGNLHSVWDGMVGDNRSMLVLSLKVQRILSDPTLVPWTMRELADHPAAADWLAESAALNREVVYEGSVRSAIRLQEIDPAAAFVPLRLTRNYAADGQLVATRRVALAGHRIARAVCHPTGPGEARVAPSAPTR